MMFELTLSTRLQHLHSLQNIEIFLKLWFESLQFFSWSREPRILLNPEAHCYVQSSQSAFHPVQKHILADHKLIPSLYLTPGTGQHLSSNWHKMRTYTLQNLSKRQELQNTASKTLPPVIPGHIQRFGGCVAAVTTNSCILTYSMQ